MQALQDRSPARKSSKISIAVLLPTYCEAQNIQPLIREIEELKRFYDLSIIVVDDSSPDSTSKIVERLQLVYNNITLLERPAKLGLGSAITDGFKLALSMNRTHDYIVTMDADYSHDPRFIPKLVATAKEGYDVVIGSRYVKGGRVVGWQAVRWLMSRVANFLASTLLAVRLHDCTSGFRCYSRDCVESIAKKVNCQTYEVNIETVRQARKNNLEIKEIPVTIVNRKRGKSKLSLGEFQGFLSYLFGMRTYQKVDYDLWQDRMIKDEVEILDTLVHQMYLGLLKEHFDMNDEMHPDACALRSYIS